MRDLEPIQPEPVETKGEPPVVARLVIEIRSDGTRTVARGLLQDASIGQEVAVKAEGTTPLALAASLIGSLFRTPLLGRILQRRALRPKPRAPR